MSAIIDQTIETYGIANWGADYFGVNRKGNLIVRSPENDNLTADVKEIIDDLQKRGINTPILLRFPQLIFGQIRKLQTAFRKSIKEFEYEGGHLCVFPMKVNQNRAVIEEYLREGTRYNFGLEAGSKAELYAALGLEQSKDSLLVLNGFKDRDFIRLAFAGAAAGKNVVIVIEKMSELDHTLDLADEISNLNSEVKMPMIGVRVKLYSKGSGKWEKSGGEAAKFGLTTTEILEVIRRLQEAGKIDMLRLLHFHIGSQLTDIKRIKNAMKEAARTYAKIRKMQIPIDYLDVGGGMAVDYDGSRTSFESSANYNAREFANDVIYVIKTVCDDENVPHPTIIQESGRYLSAYHAILVTNVQDEIETVVEDLTPMTMDVDDPTVVKELFDLRDTINAKNYREYYHDALEHREELFTMFNLGLISLEAKGKGEVLFWDICEKADQYAQLKKYVSEEFADLRRLMCAKYLANFSVFRSMPDNWALEQLFPIIPIHKLNKKPTEYATLCDITCDSDGIVDKFVDLHDTKAVLELHKLVKNESYYLAMMLVGAYQEVMGNNHNLFGVPHEAHIFIGEDGYIIRKVIYGATLGDSLASVRFDAVQLHDTFRKAVMLRIKEGVLTNTEGSKVIEFYEDQVDSYTYLTPNGTKDKK
ncbi:MAG TPA: biosynthetic arginine decarboxylase [Pyrinomonadaceae bacterium]|nr:biosynthetic arginine decarboxylase [Chloracidobacterium sp.]MBP9936461.1 biosynthetic arginine decarboxylase [Pyrinomonadaceae bacterium]MBK9438520.1 biosynthetic arginine decarboxylase [Chloracidobacterium sp.]MBL0242419.1 biosynthetic arginine decarboxylase [Chloracidobacterium sp.]HQX56862.1 biosynthetic arginine decarboxylase [Pyrinomonadaceae bacterium]